MGEFACGWIHWLPLRVQHNSPGSPHWIIIDMNVRQLAPKKIHPGRLAPNSQLLVDWKCTILHQDMNNMKAFARLHWWFFCGKTLSTTYSMLLWKLFGLFSLGGNDNFAEIGAGSLSRRAASPLDFASALCSNFRKDWFHTRRKFTSDCFVRVTRSTCVRIFLTASQLSQLTSPSPSLRN